MVIKLIAYVLMLCAGLLIGCGSPTLLANPQTDNHGADAAAGDLESPSSEPTAISTPTSQEATGPDSNAYNPSSNGLSKTTLGDSIGQDDLLAGSSEPELGEITFALDVTDEYEPINPGYFFAWGITEVHAIFNYSGMSDHTWERVWYLNESEISRSSGLWAGPGSGVFDYFIDNGGKPLPPGDWILELYVDGKLQALGVFIIAGENAE